MIPNEAITAAKRDELAALIWGVEADEVGTFKTGVTSKAADDIADAILADGWRPPTPPAHAIEPAKSPREDARAVIDALTGRVKR